jgi:spore coat polysaccharide biosynthesis protein SpsF (cytidylyltransferase family)
MDALVAARDTAAEAKPGDTLSPRERAVPEIEAWRSAGGRPLGYGVELVRTSALVAASAAIPASEPHHRVHVTSWLSLHGRIGTVALPADWPLRPTWRWTIDTYEDLAMARSAFRLFGSEAATIDYPAMVRLLDGVPEIAAMNEHIVQKKLEEG